MDFVCICVPGRRWGKLSPSKAWPITINFPLLDRWPESSFVMVFVENASNPISKASSWVHWHGTDTKKPPLSSVPSRQTVVFLYHWAIWDITTVATGASFRDLQLPGMIVKRCHTISAASTNTSKYLEPFCFPTNYQVKPSCGCNGFPNLIIAKGKAWNRQDVQAKQKEKRFCL